MIKIFVQMQMTAMYWTTFQSLGNRERVLCQRLANRMKCAVRAMEGECVLAEFIPHRVECSEGC